MESGQIFKGMLLVSDIDGTLTELTEIPQNNIEAINRFIALGGTFTLCTGRPKCALAEILPQLKVTAPIITINGGYIYSPQDDTVLFGAELPESVRDFVFALLERFAQVGAMLVEPDNYWVIRWGDESIEGVAQRRDMYMREGCCRMYSEEEGPKRWHKVVLIVPPEQIPTVRAYVEEQNPQGFYPVQSDAFYLELVPQGISKGRGLMALAERLGLALDEVMAVGDSGNDLTMLEAAGLGVAMGNATEEIKQAADVITADNNHDGVAEAIEKYVL